MKPWAIVAAVLAAALLTVLAVLLAGDGDRAGRDEGEATRLVVEVRPAGRGGAARRRVIDCGGTEARTRDCSRLRELSPEDLEPPEDERVCTQIYGGPATARIRGNLRGEAVNVRFDLRNGCHIARWERFSWLLGAPPALVR